MSRFPEEVLLLLEEAGWYEGRNTATTRYAEANAAQSYPWQAAAARFLSEFGGLLLRFLRRDGSVTTLHFHVPQALATKAAITIHADAAARLGHGRYTIIGQAYAEDLVLLMDAEGRVYGDGCDECLYLIAESGEEAITTICLDLAFQVVFAG